MLFGLLRKSNWNFVTSAGGEASITFPLARFGVAAAKGTLHFKHKTNNKKVKLNYTASGVTGGFGLIPIPVKFSFAMPQMPSSGVIYKTPHAGKHLTIDEMKGGFLMVSAGADVGTGFSYTLMFLGISKWLMRLTMLNPLFGTLMLASAEACVRVGGMNANVIPANAGATMYGGSIS